VVVNPSVAVRADRHAALGDPARLAIVDELWVSDRAPVELRRIVRVESNLLAHHLDVLEDAGLISRSRSAGDGRRRYVRLCRGAFEGLSPGRRLRRDGALFVCTQNSARSQLAAALWRDMTRAPAESAGTRPADRVHPGAVAAASRAGLDLSAARPKPLDDLEAIPEIVVTVCDAAHEELGELDLDDSWLHWSIPDPVLVGTRVAFDAVLVELRARIADAIGGADGQESR
jgi:ArsR family transcriptional regulator, arsenate/arsenite/antimonite-responsive transcriptional repressor / arsenate reductase (thioredoxin)